MSRHTDLHPHYEHLLNNDFNKVAMMDNGMINAEFYPIKLSKYDINMERWLEYFPLKQIHVIDADNLIKDPSTEMMKIEEYLGLGPKCTPDKFELNEIGFYCV